MPDGELPPATLRSRGSGLSRDGIGLVRRAADAFRDAARDQGAAYAATPEPVRTDAQFVEWRASSTRAVQLRTLLTSWGESPT
jgi:hypothetical protein